MTQLVRRYTASEQRAALEWLMETAVPPLRVLQLRGEIADADIDGHLPALEALKDPLDFLAQPWVREAIDNAVATRRGWG